MNRTLKKLVSLVLSIMLAVGSVGMFPHTAYATTDTFTLAANTNANGYGLWTVPAAVTSADVACWGAGGGGGDGTDAGGAGGGGGAFASSTISSLVEGTSYTIFIGAKGIGATTAAGSGGNGGNSSFATTTVVGAGGTGGPGANAADSTGGAGGTTAASTGTVRNAGGQGGNGVNAGDKGGGGGGAAGPHGVGINSSLQVGGNGDNNSGGTGGAAGANPGGDNANGGGGGGGGANAGAGGAGGVPGGGGGGGEGNGADGGGGQCTVTYTAATAPPTVSTDFASNVAATTATLNGTKTGGDNATEHGFAYSTDSVLVTGVSTTTIGALNSNSPFSSAISSLTADTTYFFRAYGTNGGGTGYGIIRSFVTGNTTVTRKLRLFEGFTVKLIDGTIILHQQ